MKNKIEKEKLSEGICHLTVFNEVGEAVNERLYFKRPKKQLKIESALNFSKYGIRKKITVNLQLKNEKNGPENADLSVTIRKLDSLQEMDQNDIMSYLWLSSEVKGNIESAAYYFLNTNNETNTALDHLLLTQGWRRFAWNDRMKSDSNVLKILPEVEGHLINGTLLGLNGIPRVNADIYLGVPGNRLQFYTSATDTLGNFVFNTKDFYGANEIVVQTNTRVDTISIIDIKSPFTEKFNAFNYPEVTFKPGQLRELQNYNLSLHVQNTYSANQLKNFIPQRVDTIPFFGKPDKTYILNDYTRFEKMEDVLREYVSEVFISKTQKDYHIKILGKVDFLNENPLILLDGVPYLDMNKVMEIDPKKVKKLEIIRDQYYYGPSFFEGILNFTSYKTNFGSSYINPNAVVLDYEGMQMQREFYHPIYETDLQLKSRLPDFRNVLYWSTAIKTDANGKGTFSFFTSDLQGTYIGVINGLSIEGIPGVNSFTFEVKR